MNFDEKVKLLRTLPQFKVSPISDIRAIAFVAREKEDEINIKGSNLYLSYEDIEKIVREYPDLADKFR